MKILVAVKRVIDYSVKIRVKKDQSGVETENVKMSINPFDEIAVEEAIKLKEQGRAREIVAVSIGNAQSEDVLRHALAMGADRGILILTDAEFEPINIAKILQAIVQKESADLMLLGKQAIDDDCNQTGQMLAGLMNYAQATFASKIEIESNEATVTREVDGGLETIAVKLPAVVTVDLRLNQPRYINLPNIMKAKSKIIEKKLLSDLNLDLRSRVVIQSVEPPKTRVAGKKVADFAELFEVIKKHGGLKA
jgi:electron transfer flavoprotein beta subunit